jgi:hypothetical protein
MVSDNGAASSFEDDDCLEKRLKEATPEEFRQLLEEFLKAFFFDQSEVPPERQPSVLCDPELEIQRL